MPPADFKVKQSFSQNEILVTWAYPDQTKIKIEYYQLNYRHYNNKSNELFSDWITIEPISVTETSYYLDTNDLIENEFYQIQMVSCSIYSHSLPTELITFKFGEELMPQKGELLLDANVKKTSDRIPSKAATFLKSVSQLDIILVIVFLFLIFLLSICVLACVVYHRSNRHQQRKKSSESKGKSK